jgi:hypothetical protein
MSVRELRVSPMYCVIPKRNQEYSVELAKRRQSQHDLYMCGRGVSSGLGAGIGECRVALVPESASVEWPWCRNRLGQRHTGSEGHMHANATYHINYTPTH